MHRNVTPPAGYRSVLPCPAVSCRVLSLHHSCSTHWTALFKATSTPSLTKADKHPCVATPWKIFVERFPVSAPTEALEGLLPQIESISKPKYNTISPRNITKTTITYPVQITPILHYPPIYQLYARSSNIVQSPVQSYSTRCPHLPCVPPSARRSTGPDPQRIRSSSSRGFPSTTSTRVNWRMS